MLFGSCLVLLDHHIVLVSSFCQQFLFMSTCCELGKLVPSRMFFHNEERFSFKEISHRCALETYRFLDSLDWWVRFFFDHSINAFVVIFLAIFQEVLEPFGFFIRILFFKLFLELRALLHD